MLDPFNSYGQDTYGGFETFDPYGSYDAATLAAMYGGSCPPIDINSLCNCA